MRTSSIHRTDITAQALCMASAWALLFALGACGFKDKPLPPEQTLAQPIKDLQYQLTAKGAQLSWSYPTESVSGARLEEIKSFELYRAVVPAEEYCSSCPIPFPPPISIPAGALPDKGGRSAGYEETALQPGHYHLYSVRSKVNWLAESKDSNIVSFFWDNPPSAPKNVQAEAGDGKTILSWKPAVFSAADKKKSKAAIEYQVYRRIGSGAFTQLGAPTPNANYVDEQVENGQHYAYQVRALGVYPKGQVEGGLSEVLHVTPKDATAPSVPEKPNAVVTEVGVKVFWNHVDDEDVSGYRVYRRLESDTQAVFVGLISLPYNMFIDKNTLPGRIYYYSISTIDNENPANESPRSAEVRAGD